MKNIYITFLLTQKHHDNLRYLGTLLFYTVLIQAVVTVYTTAYYYFGYINTTSTLNNITFDICVILPLIISIYVLYTNLNLQKYDLYYNISQVLIILLLILNEIFYHIYITILRSIKFRLIIYIITISLTSIGLNKIFINCMILLLILITLTIATYKSNNRFKFMSKLILNLTIIITFWYYVKDINCVSIMLILIQKNMIFTFDEWDFDIDLPEFISLGLHNYCIGDPSMPPKPPVPEKLKYLVHDEDTEGPFENSGKKYPDPSKFSTWNMDNSSENNYKQFLLINDCRYLTEDLKSALEWKINITETDLPVQKGYLVLPIVKCDYYFVSRPTLMSVEEHIEMLQYNMYSYNYEYNTLTKANTYYLQKGLDTQGNPLHHSYKDAAEGWQKRQIYQNHHWYIKAYNKYITEDTRSKQTFIFSKPHLYAYNKYCRYANENWEVKQVSLFSNWYVDMYKFIKNPNVSNTLCVKNHFNDKVAHLEIRENLFYIKLYLIQCDLVLKYIESGISNRYVNGEFDDKIQKLSGDWYLNENFFKLIKRHYADYDNEINKIIRDCYNEYKNAYDEYAKYEHWHFYTYKTNSEIYARFADIINYRFAENEALKAVYAISANSIISEHYIDKFKINIFSQSAVKKAADKAILKTVWDKSNVGQQYNITIRCMFLKAAWKEAWSLD